VLNLSLVTGLVAEVVDVRAHCVMQSRIGKLEAPATVV